MKVGDIMDDPPAAAVVNGRALIPFWARSLLLMKYRRDEVDEQQRIFSEAREKEDEDVRTLSVKWNRTGERFRTWDSVWLGGPDLRRLAADGAEDDDLAFAAHPEERRQPLGLSEQVRAGLEAW